MATTSAERERMRAETLSAAGATVVLCTAGLAYVLIAKPTNPSPPTGVASKRSRLSWR